MNKFVAILKILQTKQTSGRRDFTAQRIFDFMKRVHMRTKSLIRHNFATILTGGLGIEYTIVLWGYILFILVEIPTKTELPIHINVLPKLVFMIDS